MDWLDPVGWSGPLECFVSQPGRGVERFSCVCGFAFRQTVNKRVQAKVLNVQSK